MSSRPLSGPRGVQGSGQCHDRAAGPEADDVVASGAVDVAEQAGEALVTPQADP
ncbi:hypothetical protein [Kocuria arenosa]|uniref:hypothetical protein n=1 Tax=Kocuria arenosa TaxID=3071446 RepID=UPI0034D58D3A